MTAREQLVAYLATLGALIIVLISAFVTGALAPEVMGKMEVFGLGTITGGLIGILRIPNARTPVAATESGDVNVTTPTPDKAAGEEAKG